MLTGNDYCDYDTSVALRELGYVGICDAYYELTGNDSYNRDSFELLYTRDFIHPDDKDRVAAPLLYQAQKWLREEKGINAFVMQIIIEGSGSRRYASYLQLGDKIWICRYYSLYEEALLEGIKEAIKLIKK